MKTIAEIPPENLVYVDESGLERDYVRERGRKFQRLNVVAALCGNVVLSPKCYSHSMTSEFFEDWFGHKLLPKVKRGQTIIMDNASFHRKKSLQKIMRRKQKQLLFLPTYSPDFNKIEKKWGEYETSFAGYDFKT